MLTRFHRNPLDVLLEPKGSVIVELWAAWATRSVVHTVHSLSPIHLSFSDSPYNKHYS